MGVIVRSAVAALIVAFLVFLITIQRNAIIATRDRAERAEQQVGERDATIETLTRTAARNRQAAARLQAKHDRIADSLTERESQIESLRHDHPDIQAWFDTPLPDALIQLRDGPAPTSTDAARQRLPGDHALQSSDRRADDER